MMTSMAQKHDGNPRAHKLHHWECCARSAHTVRSFGCRQILGPYVWPLLTSFWFHTGFFSQLPMHLGCSTFELSPFVAHFNHFYPFSIPHIELSPLWGPQESRGDVAILISPQYGDPKKAGVM